MLSIRVHGQHMTVARRLRFAQAVQYRRAFTLIARQYHDSQPGVFARDVLQRFCRALVTAIDDDPHRTPELSCRAYGFDNFLAGVVAWDEDQMRARSDDHAITAFIGM